MKRLWVLSPAQRKKEKKKEERPHTNLRIYPCTID